MSDHIVINSDEKIELPSLKEQLTAALQRDPLYLQRTMTSDGVCQQYGITQDALRSLHYRGTGPKYHVPPGTRRRLYTLYNVLDYLFSDDPSAQRILKRAVR